MEKKLLKTLSVKQNNKLFTPFLGIPLYSKIEETFYICASLGFTLFSALQSPLKKILISNVSHWKINSISTNQKTKKVTVIPSELSRDGMTIAFGILEIRFKFIIH